MKKLFFLAVSFLVGITAIGQTLELEEVIPISGNIHLENLIVETLIPSADAYANGVPAGAKTYRVFIDMTETGILLGYTGNPISGFEFSVTSTEPFFNQPASDFGSDDATYQGTTFWTIYPSLKYDSYGTDGRVGNSLAGIPYSMDINDGIIDGYTDIANLPYEPIGPVLILQPMPIWLDNVSTSVSHVDAGVTTQRAVGVSPENAVLVAQYTTTGVFTINASISVTDLGMNLVESDGIVYSNVPLEDNPPVVEITYPSNDTTFNINDVVTITAEASDDNGLTSVEFFINGESLGVSSSTDNGTHTIEWIASGLDSTITVVATDNASPEQTTSDTISVSVYDPCPLNVNIQYPIAGTYPLDDIILIASAFDCDEVIPSVEFSVGGVVVGTDNNGADGWSYLYSPIEASNVEIIATALGVASSPVIVSFNNSNLAPVIDSITPSDFDIPVGTDTTFIAFARDADGTISSVEFEISNGNESVSYTDVDGSNGFSFTFAPSEAGQYYVTAIATDNLGAVSASISESFNSFEVIRNEISLNLDQAILDGDSIEIPVFVTYLDGNLNSIDFNFDFNYRALIFESFVNHSGLDVTINSDGPNLTLSAFKRSAINTDDKVLGLRFIIRQGVTSDDFNFNTALLNGNIVETNVLGEVFITTPPVITLLGENPMSLYIDETYIEPGATAIDSIDGDISDSILIRGDVNTNAAGSYIVLYDVSNAAGTPATTAVRTVNVMDTTTPVITLIGNDTMRLNLGETYEDPGAFATDNADGDISDSLVISGTVNTNEAGTYTLQYNVSDKAGLAAIEVTRTVNVIDDNTAPVISILGDNPMDILFGETYVEPGATAFDDFDGDITDSIIISSFEHYTIPGSYEVRYNVTDIAGNMAEEVIRIVNFIEETSATFYSESSKTSIYPNPANNDVHVNFEGTADIAILNISGQIIELRKKVMNSTIFNVSELPVGIYTVMINNKAYRLGIIK